MPSELQRVAQALVEVLDEIPGVVAYLEQVAHRCRENAALIGGMSNNPAAQRAAMQLDEAAHRCEQAAHYLSQAPPKARVWADQMVRGMRPTTPEQSPNKRNKATEKPLRRGITSEDVPRILERLPRRVGEAGRSDKTSGLWIDADGTEHDLVSGYDRHSADADRYVVEEKLGPPPHSLRIASHVEIKFAMMMRERGLTDETIVINHVPCRRPWGCNILLPYFLPKGSSLTVYDKDGFGKTYRGRGKPA